MGGGEITLADIAVAMAGALQQIAGTVNQEPEGQKAEQDGTWGGS